MSKQFTALLVDFYMAEVFSRTTDARRKALYGIERFIARAIECPICGQSWTGSDGCSSKTDEFYINIFCSLCNCAFKYGVEHNM